MSASRTVTAAWAIRLPEVSFTDPEMLPPTLAHTEAAAKNMTILANRTAERKKMLKRITPFFPDTYRVDALVIPERDRKACI